MSHDSGEVDIYKQSDGISKSVAKKAAKAYGAKDISYVHLGKYGKLLFGKWSQEPSIIWLILSQVRLLKWKDYNEMTKLSNRVLQMEESVTLAASARAKALKAQGRDILSLTLGEPDFVTPKNIQDAAIASIENGKASFYTVASGLPELKDAISTYMKNFYGYAVKPNEVVVGTGAKLSYMLSLLQSLILVMKSLFQHLAGFLT